MVGSDPADRHRTLQVVRRVLAADCACAEQDLLGDGIVILPARAVPGRRRFPLRARPLLLVTLGAGVVVSCHPDRVAWLRSRLGQLDRDSVFSATTIARLVQYVESDGQMLHGPALKYVCSPPTLRLAPVPDRVEVTVVTGEDIRWLYGHTEFPNALSYRADSPRPDVLATAATVGSKVVGVAGASADCDAMWQVGVDVVASARGTGIGRSLVSRLTAEVLRAGRVPYYSVYGSNVRSLSLAVSTGYWPAWVELEARDLQPGDVAALG